MRATEPNFADRSTTPTKRLALAPALLALLALGLLATPASAAEPPPILWGKEPLVCPTGTGAGQCRIPRGIAADSHNGHIFVADSINRRIDEFDPLGRFVKAWGWGVDTGAAALERCTEASTCQEGSTGSGTGQFGSPQGVAVDSAGDVYVTDRGIPSNNRVQKFNRKGEFVLMFGGGVNKTKVDAGGKTEAEENLCPFAPADVCQKGTIGAGQGRFGAWPATGSYIAVYTAATAPTADDKVYVGDVGRIQIFNVAGEYQGECPASGTVNSLATDAVGNIYYNTGTIRKLSPACVDITPPGAFELEDPDGTPVGATAVAVDSEGNVYAFGPTIYTDNKQMDPIFEFSPAGERIAEFGKGEFSNQSTGLATNLCPGNAAPGNLYATNPSLVEGEESKQAFLRAWGTDPGACFKARTQPATPVAETTATLRGTVNPSGALSSECRFEYGPTTAYGTTVPCAESPAAIGAGTAPVPVHADLAGLPAATTFHFRLRATVAGTEEIGADESFKTLGPPLISDEHTVSVTQTEATLKALVNPEGFPTTYRFQYTTQADFEAQDFAAAQSTPATPIGEDRTAHSVTANIAGLVPGATYRWRLLATNTAVLNGGIAEGEALTLRTYLPSSPETDCQNQPFRYGASAFLPDCRAYEMVSPLDKNGGDVVSELSNPGDPGGYVQARPDGDALTYTAISSFAGAPANFRFNQYLAERHERGEAGEGWANRGIHQPVSGQGVDLSIFGFSREFMAFTPDLCSAWLLDHQTPPPTADGQKGYRNLYRRQNCSPGEGDLEALTPEPPPLPAGAPETYVGITSVQGISADGAHAIFAASANLTPEALESSTVEQLYDRFAGQLHLVSVLPGGEPATGQNKVGSGTTGNLATAVSPDGSRVYWTSGSSELFLREHPEQGVVAKECSKPAKACTVPVGPAGSVFWAASTDGSKAIYTQGGTLYEFDLGRYEAEPASASQPLATGVTGVAGAGQDLSRVYFASSLALPGSGANSENDEAQEGQPNLYLYQAGAEPAFAFVATLTPGDVGAFEPGTDVAAYNLVAQGPYERATRVSADGSRIAFDSRAPLTGYDNTSAGGKPAVEVFAYEAGGALHCVSCNPAGARPSAAPELLRPYEAPWEKKHVVSPNHVFAAAWIPPWEHKLHASNVLSADGNRLFFNSNDALLPRDANGAQDVYEWEAPGAGRCTAAKSNPSYFPQNGGCLYLISGGENAYESEFWEASPDGADVFFTTEASLLSQDPGLIDLYDARVEGGFPQPTAIASCEGEACQSPPAAPDDPTPASSSFEGAGNVVEPPACRKGKVRRKGRCVARHHKSKHRRHHRAHPDTGQQR